MTKIEAILNKIRGECEWLQRYEVLASLADMYSQYCGSGHAFMSAGENAEIILNQRGVLISGNCGEVEKINWENIRLEVQLSDLLYAVGKATPFKLDVVCEGQTTLYIRDRNLYPSTIGVVTQMDKWDKKTHGRRGAQYNLQKSVKENLKSSEELTEFLFNLICTK